MKDRVLCIKVSTLVELCKKDVPAVMENILEFLSLACSENISATLNEIEKLFNEDIDVVMQKNAETSISP